MRSGPHFERDTTTDEQRKALYAEQVEQLYSNAGLGILASIINSFILLLVQRNVTPWAASVVWVAVLSFVSLLRYRDIRAFRRRSPEGPDAGYWGRRFIFGLALSGTVWGSFAIFLFPAGSFAHQTFLVFVIGGMVAGAAAAFSSITKAFLAYSVPALGPVIVRFALVPDELHLAMAGMTFLFGVMMYVVARWIKTVRDASVNLRFENTCLVSDIAAAELTEKALRQARDRLEQRVQERTEELQKAYHKLLSETQQRRKAEEQLLHAQKMEAIGTLAGGIAHDFNNMLAVIMGNAEMALEDAADGNSHQIEQILKASKRARDLVKQILTFSRKREGRRKALKLAPLMKETAKLLRGSLPSTVSIEVNIGTGSDTIIGDPSQIQQVLMNLASNAAQAMGEDGGTLSLDLSNVVLRQGDAMPEDSLQPGKYVRLTVRDTGSGMGWDVQSRIFEPFFTTKMPDQGTGMGLAVVFGIVKSHAGAITVESEVGRGSVFTVFLPEAEETAEEELRKGGSLPTGNERVLMVDDEPAVAEIISGTLKRLGYDVTTAMGGLEGWTKFEDSPQGFDLVITDHVMPGITGMRLAEKMLDVRRDLPIILLTGYSETISPEKAKAAGIRGFLMKPVVKRKLAETVRCVLDGGDRTVPLAKSNT